MLDSLNKTLIIRFSSVGDIVLSSLLVRTLRRRFPQNHIDFLLKSEYADLVRYNPHINRVIEFPSGGSVNNLFRLRRTIRKERYDLIVDIHDSIRSRLLSLGAHRLVRVDKRKVARWLLVNVKWDLYKSLGGAPSVAERYLETVKPFGVRDDGGGLELHVPRETRDRVGMMLQDGGILPGSPAIGICPSAKHANKMWLKERFAETAAALVQRHGAPVLLFGSIDEAPRCDEIAAMVKAALPGARVANLAGSLSLLETAAAMDHCGVVVTNDSGLMHIAAARKRNVVALFGPTVRQFGFFPFGTASTVVEHPTLACRPCTHIGLPDCPRGHFKCMRELDSGTVITAATKLLDNLMHR
jgi:lipopolysaccharide heptosyltransferase II